MEPKRNDDDRMSGEWLEAVCLLTGPALVLYLVIAAIWDALT